MAQPERSPGVRKLGGKHPAGVLEDPEPIAQRFAHTAELRNAALRVAEAQRPPRPAPTLAATRAAGPRAKGNSMPKARLLIAGAVLATLALSLFVGVLWLRAPGGSQAEQAGQSPERETAAPSVVLTASERIEAVAGVPANFPIALDGSDGVPSRSVIAVKGLPPGSSLSEGRPYGENEWTLKPDQIGDLKLILAPGANGEFKLGVALIAPDDKIVAEAETLLAITPAPIAIQAAPDPAIVPQSDGETLSLAPAQAEAAVAEPAPAAEMEQPSAAEASPAPPAEGVQQSGAAASTGDPQAATVGQSDDGASGLGTVEPSMFVNLREAPSSSSTVLGVVAKGAKLAALDRKRGWVQVTDPESGKTGWIYSGLLVGEEKPYRRPSRVAPAETEAKSESFWSRLGRWLSPSESN
jgi:hypothetical protein